MIIFGTKTTRTSKGIEGRFRCGHCNNEGDWELIEQTLWFSLFFLPVIPLKHQYYSMCPICNRIQTKTKEEFKALIQGRALGARQ